MEEQGNQSSFGVFFLMAVVIASLATIYCINKKADIEEYKANLEFAKDRYELKLFGVVAAGVVVDKKTGDIYLVSHKGGTTTPFDFSAKKLPKTE